MVGDSQEPPSPILAVEEDRMVVSPPPVIPPSRVTTRSVSKKQVKTAPAPVLASSSVAKPVPPKPKPKAKTSVKAAPVVKPTVRLEGLIAPGEQLPDEGSDSFPSKAPHTPVTPGAQVRGRKTNRGRGHASTSRPRAPSPSGSKVIPRLSTFADLEGSVPAIDLAKVETLQQVTETFPEVSRFVSVLLFSDLFMFISSHPSYVRRVSLEASTVSLTDGVPSVQAVPRVVVLSARSLSTSLDVKR